VRDFFAAVGRFFVAKADLSGECGASVAVPEGNEKHSDIEHAILNH